MLKLMAPRSRREMAVSIYGISVARLIKRMSIIARAATLAPNMRR